MEPPRTPAGDLTDGSSTAAFEKSNCKTRSSLDPERYGYVFIESQSNPDLEFAHCLDAQRQAILAQVTPSVSQGNTPSVTQFRDFGFVEFHVPGKPDQISRCSYVVEKNLQISSDLLKLIHGQLQLGTDMQQAMKLYKQLTNEAKKLVTVECLIS